MNVGDSCKVIVTPDEKGGVIVEIQVPTYMGGAVLRTSVERDPDGDWRVFLPAQPHTLLDVGTNEETKLPEGEIVYYTEDRYQVSNGILYLGAPDVEREDAWQVVA